MKKVSFLRKSRHRLFLLFAVSLAWSVPGAFCKEPSLTAIELYDGASGAAYVQLAEVLINGKAELRDCSQSQGGSIDKSTYGKLPKITLTAGDVLERGSDGVLRYTTNNPNSHHNRDPKGSAFSSREQSACAEMIHAKPPLPCTRWVLGEREGGDEALFALRQQLTAELQALNKKLGALAGPAPAAAEPRADDVWSQVAAATLAQRCPALLTMMMDGQAAPLALRDAWRWWHWLQAEGRAPSVLEIGAGPLAAPLKAMVHALGGRFLSVGGDRPRAQALSARLAAAGLDADVRHVPLVPATLGAHAGHVPDLSTLPADAAGFDLLVISAPHAGHAPADALLTLPVAVGRLDPNGFRACVWAPGDAPLRTRIAQTWHELAPALTYIDQAFDGQALCVHPA